MSDRREVVVDQTCDVEQARYTLAEADRELRRQECSMYGHDFSVTTTLGSDGPSGVACDRCGKSWRVVDSEVGGRRKEET